MELEPGWLNRQIETNRRETAAIGGSWEPHKIISHCLKLTKENEMLRQRLKSYELKAESWKY